jgi:hypothetical protein
MGHNHRQMSARHVDSDRNIVVFGDVQMKPCVTILEGAFLFGQMPHAAFRVNFTRPSAGKRS